MKVTCVFKLLYTRFVFLLTEHHIFNIFIQQLYRNCKRRKSVREKNVDKWFYLTYLKTADFNKGEKI